MRHRKNSKNLAKTQSEHKGMVLNLVKSLITNGEVKTTEARGKELKRICERLITSARKNDLSSRRRVLKVIRDPAVVKVLFDEIAPAFSGSSGGYTRIVKTGFRRGDNASMVSVKLLK